MEQFLKSRLQGIESKIWRPAEHPHPHPSHHHRHHLYRSSLFNIINFRKWSQKLGDRLDPLDSGYHHLHPHHHLYRSSYKQLQEMESKIWRQTWSTFWPRCQTSSSFSTAQSTLPSTFPSTPSNAIFNLLQCYIYLYLCLTISSSDFKLQWLEWSELLVPDVEAKARSGKFSNQFKKWPRITSKSYIYPTRCDLHPKVPSEIRNPKNEHHYRFPLRYEIPSEMEVALYHKELIWFLWFTWMG